MNEIKKSINNYYDFWFGINSIYEIWAKKQGLTSYGLFVLYAINENKGKCTQKMICDQLLFPKQTVNTILNNFEKKGLILRETMETDRRNKLVTFTDEGASYAKNILNCLYGLEELAMSKMKKEDRLGMSEGNDLFLGYLQEVFGVITEEI